MILARETIATLARAVIHGTVAEDGVVHAGLVTLQICEAGERFAAAAGVAGEGLGWFRSRWRFRTRILVHSERVASNWEFLWGIPSTNAIASTAGRTGDAGGQRRSLVHLEILDGKFFNLHCGRIHVW